MRKTVLFGAALSLLAAAASADPAKNQESPPRTTSILHGLYEFDDGTWHVELEVDPSFARARAEERFAGSEPPAFSDYRPMRGFDFNFTQKLVGNLQYQWTAGRKPEFSFAGTPARLKIKNDGFFLGFTYRR